MKDRPIKLLDVNASAPAASRVHRCIAKCTVRSAERIECSQNTCVDNNMHLVALSINFLPFYLIVA